MLTYLPPANSENGQLVVGESYPYARPLSVPAGQEGAVAYLPADATGENLLQLVYFTELANEDKTPWATHSLELFIYQGRSMLTHVLVQIDGMGCIEALPRLPLQQDEALMRWAREEGRQVLLVLVDSYTGRVSALREISATPEWAAGLRSAVMAQMENLPAELLPTAAEADQALALWQMMTASSQYMVTSPQLRPLPPLLNPSAN